MDYILPLQKLIESFCMLPGVGPRTAERYAFSVLSMDEDKVAQLASCLVSAKTDIGVCPVCGNISDGGPCFVCNDEKRDKSVICVVEDTRAVMAIERVREYGGLYHVLGRMASPSDDLKTTEERIVSLLGRLDGVKEVIIATNPDVRGDMTAMYIQSRLADKGVKITRIANGVPVGADLEYADAVTLGKALSGRYVF